MNVLLSQVMIAAKTLSAFDGLDESERIRVGHQRRLIDSKLIFYVSSVVSVFYDLI